MTREELFKEIEAAVRRIVEAHHKVSLQTMITIERDADSAIDRILRVHQIPLPINTGFNAREYRRRYGGVVVPVDTPDDHELWCMGWRAKVFRGDGGPRDLHINLEAHGTSWRPPGAW